MIEFEYENSRGITEILYVTFHMEDNSVVIDEVINENDEYLVVSEIPKVRLEKIIYKCKEGYSPIYKDIFID